MSRKIDKILRVDRVDNTDVLFLLDQIELALLWHLWDNSLSVASYMYYTQLEPLTTFPTKGRVVCHAKQWPTPPKSKFICPCNCFSATSGYWGLTHQLM